MQVSPGQQLMSLIPLDDVWVTANFKETQLRHMHEGQRVEITTDTFGGGQVYKAHIDSIAGASGAKFSLLPPENATGNYVKVVQRIPVKILLEPGENRTINCCPVCRSSPPFSSIATAGRMHGISDGDAESRLGRNPLATSRLARSGGRALIPG